MSLNSTINWTVVGRKRAIKTGDTIGEGGQSKVFKGVFDKKFVAVKSMSNEGDAKEVEILRKLDHPNIIKIFFTDTSYPMTFMALELCEYTLKEYVKNPDIGIILEPSAIGDPLKPLEVLKEVTEGLHYLHNGQKFCTVHRDLKPSNILFQYVGREKLWRVKISDFGISKDFYGDKTSTISSLRGSSGYTAPELLRDIKGKIRKETDMFSLGVIFYYTLSNGKHPFSNDPFEWELKIRDSEPCLDELESEYTGIVESLILSLLLKNYRERPSVREVKSHHIFWDGEKKLDFLQKASNYMEDRVKHQALINKLEESCQDVIRGKKWKDVICSETYNQEIKRVLEKDKNCENKTSLQDLLRKIRNWASHYFDAKTTEEFRAEIGEYPNGFVNFFSSHFPKLLPCVFEIMMTQKNEDIFKHFYGTEIDSTIELNYEEKPEASLSATCVSTPVDADSKDAENNDEDILPSSDDEDDQTAESRPIKLSLREYQKELAEQALNGDNSLIIAPTGSGKTAVANEIIKNHLESVNARSIIFLVSKTTLARQQYEFFSRHLSENLKEDDIAYLIGEIAANTAVGAIIKSMKLIVLTPQILIDELARQKSFISFDDISMMIFDECHNATKKHPYKVLMDMMLDYKAEHPNYSIQIVGMTASPGVGKGKTRDQVLENLTTLLANLDVKLSPAVVMKNVDELKRFQNEIDESFIRVRIEYDRFSRKIQDAMQLIEKKLSDLEAHSSDSIEPPASRTMQVYEHWIVSLMNQIKTKWEDRDKSSDAISYAEHLKMYYNLLYFKNLIPNAIEYTNTLDQCEQTGKVGSFLRKISSKLEIVSRNAEVPMLIKLFDVLKEEFRKNSNSRCIIFVPRKLIASALVKCIRDNEDLKHLEPEYVTGSADHAMGGMTKTKQESNIRAFREGNCKVLIATSVAEEGLDIHACNLVIMYNYVTGEVGRIQRAGRGRAENSRSILITSQGSAQIQKEKMNSICAFATKQALKDLEELLPEDRIHKIEQIQRIQRNERLCYTSKIQQQVDEALKWKILCGKCKAYITRADMLRQIKNQHKFVIDPEFPSRVEKTNCKPRVLVPGLPFTQIATFTCKNAECMYPLGLEMQYKGNNYPILKAEQLIFKDDKGDARTARKWNKCPFAIKEGMDDFDEDETMDSQMVKEFAIAQRKSTAKGFSTDDISDDESFEILVMANS